MPIIDREAAARRLNVISLLFLILGIIIGIWVMCKYKVIDAEYIAKSVAYPSLYPIADATTHLNGLYLICVFSVFAFFSAVCHGFACVVYASAASGKPVNKSIAAKTAPKEPEADDDTEPKSVRAITDKQNQEYVICPVCDERQPKSNNRCFNCSTEFRI